MVQTEQNILPKAGLQAGSGESGNLTDPAHSELIKQADRCRGEPEPFERPKLDPGVSAELSFLLRAGERAEAGRGDLEGAAELYRVAARETAPPDVRRLALARLAALESRRGESEEAKRLWSELVEAAVRSSAVSPPGWSWATPDSSASRSIPR